ncbi:hypothetical protein B0H63DRAFT_555223 [Podospora didyma]|uniref:Uncharacterized protein n=1 Tax=Podospora didyma TaxID=330526 RepID=A0AAE0P5R7_9PEZI|nr:hypothetical protein B0H63DRAFT_555223 [Podospora didyma]
MVAESFPFSSSHQLNNELDLAVGATSLPGHPLVCLDDEGRLATLLESELCCENLEKMAPHLWTMSTHSSSNIRPLHRQAVLGREILIIESPRLHLVWYYGRVFIKPPPKYLLSHEFWHRYLSSNQSSLGSRTDPSGGRTRIHTDQLAPEGVTWPQFCAFISDPDAIGDGDVSGRYHCGGLRLSRLSFYCMFFLHKWNFEYMPTQYLTFFSWYFGPLLFVFAAVLLELSAMQLEMTVQQTTGSPLGSMWVVYRWFSVAVMLCGLVVSTLLADHVVHLICDEWVFALKGVRRRRKLKLHVESG